MKKKNLDMTVGNPLHLLTAFTLPMLAGNILNQLYSVTDSIIVGRVLGQTALAGIGVCMPIVLLTAAVIFGVNIGVSILMSQSFGRKDMDEMRRILANSLYLGLLVSAAMCAVGIPLTVPVLRLMGTPEGPLAQAVIYMRINFMTCILPMLYFLFNNAFRGMGDSMTALYCLIVSVIANVFLDILFVAVFHWGVAGSAWATAAAQALSVVFAVCMLFRKYEYMRLRKADMKIDLPMAKNIMRIAIPIALQSGFNNLGNVIVQGCINGFGEAVMAAYTAASRVGTLSLMPVENIANSLSVYTGQNFGAKKKERIPAGVKAAWVMCTIVSVVLGLMMILFGREIMRLFLEEPSPEVMHTAYRYLLIAAVPGILDGIMCIYQQVLRGVGNAKASMISGFIQLGVKVALAVLGAYLLFDLNVVWLAWPISFAAASVYPYLKYRKFIRTETAA